MSLPVPMCSTSCCLNQLSGFVAASATVALAPIAPLTSALCAMTSPCTELCVSLRTIVVSSATGFAAGDSVTVTTLIGGATFTDTLTAPANVNPANANEMVLVIPTSLALVTGSMPVTITASATLTRALIGAPGVDVVETILAGRTRERERCRSRRRCHSRRRCC
jgi:hypothetical protein